MKAKASIDSLLINYPSAVSLTSSDSRIFGSEFLSESIRYEFYDDVVAPYKAKLEVWYGVNKTFRLNVVLCLLTVFIVVFVY